MKKIVATFIIAILLFPAINGVGNEKNENVSNENHDYKVVMAVMHRGMEARAYARMVEGNANQFIFHWGDGKETKIYSNGIAMAEHFYKNKGVYKV